MGRSLSRSTKAIVSFVALVIFLAGCTDTTVSGSGDLGTLPPAAVPLPTVQESAASPSSDEDSDETTVTTGEPTPTPVTTEPTPTPEGPAPIRIATVMGETNVMRFLDAPAVAGVGAMVAQLNEDGGVLGRPVQLRRYDTGSRLSLIQRQADALLRDPPDLVIVSCDVDFARPILDLAEQEGWLTISPCADDIGYATGAWGPRNFTLGAPAEPRGAIAAEMAYERYGPTAMVLRDVTNPEAQRFCNGFERAFRELGGTVVYRDEFNYDTLEPLLDRLAERGRPTDFITLCSHVPGGGAATPNIITQIRIGGFAAPIVSGLSVDETSWFGTVPTLQEMSFVSWSSTFGNDPDSAVNTIIQAAATNTETPRPGVTTVLGADAIDLWARAAESVRSVEPSAVATAMGTMLNEDALTGSISFTGGSRMDLDRTYRILRISGGEVGVPELVVLQG